MKVLLIITAFVGLATTAGAQPLQKTLLGKWQKQPAQTIYIDSFYKNKTDTENYILKFNKNKYTIIYKNKFDYNWHNPFYYTVKDSAIVSDGNTQYFIKLLTADQLVLKEFHFVVKSGNVFWAPYSIIYFKKE